MPLIYEEVKLDGGYRINLFVEIKLEIDTNSVESLNDIHIAEVLTNLKLSKSKLGLLINFNLKYLKDGIERLIL